MDKSHHHHEHNITEVHPVNQQESVSDQKYTCPMHPQVIKNAPGKCPLCGMDLVSLATTNNSGEHKYDKHAGHHTSDFLKRLWICVIITIPVLLLSKMIQLWLHFALSFQGDIYLLLALAAVIYFYGGMPFLKGMYGEIRSKNIGMMTLVAIAITVAFIYSAATVFGLKGMDFFWELATLIDIMLLGHWLEMRSQMAASKALQTLVALLPSIVHVERDGKVSDISLKELRNGDIIIIKPGEKIAADGIVLEGISYVNESMLTGESVPVKKKRMNKLLQDL